MYHLIGDKMREYEVTIEYLEPRVAKVLVNADGDIEAEDLALEKFEDDFPDSEQIEIKEVKEVY